MFKKTLLALSLLGVSMTSLAAPQAEYLNRGVIAMKMASGVYVSWRSLESDAKSMTFDVYRDGVKVNDTPIVSGTNLVDREGTATSKYVVKAYVNEKEVESTDPITPWGDIFLRVKLDRPAGGTIEGNSKLNSSKHDPKLVDDYTYSPNDCSVGDVDGDGEYEIFVKWYPSNAQDNSLAGKTGSTIIDCYKLDGTKLWRVDLGQNIRSGAHYTQFMVYDFDGDGKAEMCCKTAPGTKDGLGNWVLMGDDDPTASYVNSKGYVLDGPEYLTVFDGQTGAELSTVAYEPLRTVHAQSSSASGWGDNYGGRSERYLAGVAYLDGEKPSIIMCRGYYTHSYLVAWDFDGKQLKKRWMHASTTKGKGAYGEGAHSLTIGDCDGDGFDEIVYGACAIDHDGSLLYRTGAGHGDALHLGDFDPDREGLEVFMVHEETSSSYKYDSEFRDAKTGEIIWSTKQSGNDIGRGLVGDLSETWRGYEIWPGSYYENGSNVNATFDCKGNLLINKRFDTCFRLYWDGDLLDELFDGKYDKTAINSNPVITKINSTLTGSSTLMNFNQWKAQSCNTTKATPCLSADILGDWREEVILWDGDNSSDLLIFSTTIPSRYRVPCLMQDHNYRMAIAWQNTGYNQPPHLGYYLPDRFSTDPQIKVTSGQTSQLVETGKEIVPIVGTWANCSGVEATGLPDGITLTTDAATSSFTIAGIPTTDGEYTYVISTTGEEVTTTLEGKFTVVTPVTLTEMAHLPLDEMTGNKTVNLVYGEASLPFAATTNPDVVPGIYGNALDLKGSNHYFYQKAYDQLTFGADDFTVEFWFNSTTNVGYIFHKGSISNDGDTHNGNWIGLELKNGNFKFAIDDDVTKSEAAGAADEYLDGKWHHIVCVREGLTKTLKLYVDNKLIAESSDNTGAINCDTENLVLANVNIDYSNHFGAMMDDFIIYKGAMSSSRVAERYQAGIAAGITDITANPTDVKKLTLIDATTGVVVATGIGETTNVTANAAPGVYLLVVQQGKFRTIDKIVKK